MSVTHNLPDLGFDSYLLVSAELSEPVGHWRVLFVLNEDLLARWRKARFTVEASGPHFLSTDGLILAEGLANPLYLDDAFGETYYTIQDSDSGEEELFDRLATDPFWWGWANDDHFRGVEDARLVAHLEADGTVKLTAATEKVQIFATIPPDVSLGDDLEFLLLRTEQEVAADAEAFFAEHPVEDGEYEEYEDDTLWCDNTFCENEAVVAYPVTGQEYGALLSGQYNMCPGCEAAFMVGQNNHNAVPMRRWEPTLY